MSDYQPTVCIDLDGVLAHYDGWVDGYHIGKVNNEAKKLAHAFHDYGVKVIILTCRMNETWEEYDYDKVEAGLRKWLDDNDLGFCEIHRGVGKPHASAYIDDRAVYFEPNKGLAAPIFETAMKLVGIDPMEGKE